MKRGDDVVAASPDGFPQYGDSNTRGFHSRASMTKAHNTLSKIMDESGHLHTDPASVKSVQVDYFL